MGSRYFHSSGMSVTNLERPIAVPTGNQIKGRLLNVVGEAIDKLTLLESFLELLAIAHYSALNHLAEQVVTLTGTFALEQHIGEDTVRCVAMESTDGLRRGMSVTNLERPIAVPTGNQIKGRLLIATQRTVSSPMCCSTSRMRSGASARSILRAV